ncbi:MAG: endonuclease/exonuclease/phosphatase family protein [Pseudonocardiaceae bacterium]
MSMARIRRNTGMLVIVAGVVMGVTVALAGSAHAATDYQIGTFNMAGGNEEHGPKGNEAPDALVRSVKDREPAFIALQEACRDWSDRLDSELPDYTVKFDPVKTSKSGSTAKCKHPSDFGNAVLYRNDFGIDSENPPAYDLKSPDGREQREMLCVQAKAKKVVVCSIHLSAGRDDADKEARIVEAKEARRILAEKYPGYVQFVGGDLNADPLSAVTDIFYHRDYGYGAHGEFKEVDSPCGNDIEVNIPASAFSLPCRGGEPTSDDWAFGEDRPVGAKKIDFIFVSQPVKVRSGDATVAPHSDHDPLWAGVNF